MSPNIPKIEKLIRLATDASASPEEARTAAHAACKLIVLSGLTFADKAIYESRERPSEPSPQSPNSSPSDESMWDWINRGSAFEGADWDWIKETSKRGAASKAESKGGKAGEAGKAGNTSSAPSGRTSGGVDSSRHVVVVRMPFGCAVCGETQERGERVAKRDSDGSRICITCWSKGLGYGDSNGGY